MSHRNVQLAHGGGGRLSAEFVRDEILSRFGAQALKGLPDAATLQSSGGRLVFSTDSFVVKPLEFPGGNIGHLAVHGTVNDIAVAGGRPRWLSLALILEEGLDFSLLRRVLDSTEAAVADCGVEVVTGDTKVVARGQCDGMYINTSGIGEALDGLELLPGRLQGGDVVLASGTLGDHGMAVMAAREKMNMVSGPVSDTAPVHRLVLAAQEFGGAIKFMRDPTRGGAAAVLNEIVQGQDVGIRLREKDIPCAGPTRAVADMLGLDLLNVASEGRVIVLCAREVSPALLKKWRAMPEGAGAVAMGLVTNDAGRVVLETLTGGHRLVDVPQGELLPRIC